MNTPHAPITGPLDIKAIEVWNTRQLRARRAYSNRDVEMEAEQIYRARLALARETRGERS